MKNSIVNVTLMILVSIFFLNYTKQACAMQRYNVPGILAQISAGFDNDVWGVNRKGLVYRLSWNGREFRWVKMYDKRLKQISVANAHYICGIDLNGIVHKLTENNQWESMGNEKIQFNWVSVGNDNSVWAVPQGPNSHIFEWQDSTWKQRQICINCGTQDELIIENINVISVANKDCIWAVDNSGKIFYRNKKKLWHAKYGPRMMHISASSDGSVWGVNILGNVYKKYLEKNLWEMVHGNLRIISVGNAHNVWGVSYNGLIYRWND